LSSDAQMELALTEESLSDTPKASKRAAENNTFVLTPNASLAQQLRRQKLISNNSRCSSKKANIHVLQRWITDSVTPEYSLATEAQLRYLWEQIITEQRDQNQDFQQLNPSYLSGQALSAWRSLKHWKIRLDELAKAETGQLLSFRKWVIEFEKRLATQQLSTIELEVAKKLSEPVTQEIEKMPLVQTYAFIDALAPLWADWLAYKFETVEPISYKPNVDSQNGSANQSQLCVLDSSDQELDAAMHWAKSIFKSDNQARVAIIDVNLKDSLKATSRRAEYVFSNAKNDIRFSRETPLLSIGCVQTVLKLLNLNKKQIDLATARHIVHSPLWHAKEPSKDETESCIQASYQTEYIERAQWDIDLCALQSDEINTSDFLELAYPSDNDSNDKENYKFAPSKLSSIFIDRHRSRCLSPLDWCDLFQSQLHQLNCFEHFTDSEWQRWIDALSDFAKLGTVSGNISISNALQQLEYCCTVSPPKISSSAPGITFMDTVEAAADYSHIWILGMDNMSWPGATRLNTLLPVSLQIQKQIPHSQPQLETELTKRLIERLTLAANQIVFSYSQFNDDLEQSPCAFVANFPEYISEKIDRSQLEAESHIHDHFEWVDCSYAPTIPEQQRAIKGGASLLKTMATSPFDAFIQWRLGAYELDSPKVGLSVLDRGNLVHNVLERVWNKLGGSKDLQLLMLDRNQALGFCKEAANEELKRFQARHGWLKQSFADLETKRLGKLVFDWLEVERNRPEFSVEFTEEKLTADIASLTFKMRLDRLDRLSDGRLVLIDYKTGQNLSRNFWLEMPPIEPQLPLYALTLENHPDALCFAKVRADKMEFIGIGSGDIDDLKGIKQQDDWPGLIENWKSSLETLATDYINGDTRAFETSVGFGRSDPFAPLHRFAEYEQLEELKAKCVDSMSGGSRS